MYKIIGGDGREYGPVSADELRRWIADGRANAQTRVQPEGATHWQTLGSVPEFADALTPKPTPTVPPPFSTSGTRESPEALGARDYDFEIGAALSRAWQLLSGNFGLIFGGTAIYLLIVFGLALLGNIPLIGLVFSLASFIITGPLLGGVYYFLVKNVRGQAAEIGDIFDGFRRAFGSLLACYIVMALIMAAACLPGGIVMAVSVIPMVKHEAVEAVPMIFAVLGFFMILVPLVYLQTSWLYSFALVMDKGLDFWTAMGVSRKMVGKHWWLFFAFILVCGLINLVGMCVCCIGLFLSLPLTFTAMMVVYDRMFPAISAQAATETGVNHV